ncbi:MAG: encapsulin [Actinobacteria bacterium]|nr:encapsulin [Actinomycetota bacterium]
MTIACNVYLRGSEVADPELAAAKTMVRRAAEVLGRLEDAVIFYGRPADGTDPSPIQPPIYTITGGSDLTGLLQAPDTLFEKEQRSILADYATAVRDQRDKRIRFGVASPLAQAEAAVNDAAAAATGMMRVSLATFKASGSPIVEAIVDAIQRLEGRGQFGPFAVVLGRDLFRDATNPSGSLVLPTDRLAEFLDGRKVLRSSVLPSDRGVVVALGGQPIELVLASDIDVRFLQVTLEPRYVLRVCERLVLRIKELDAVCSVIMAGQLWDPDFAPRKARS